MKRLMVYSHDTFGLGNIRRLLAICDYLIQREPELNILLMSGSPILQHFPLPERTDYIKLPSVTRTQEGKYRVKYLESDTQQVLALRAEILRSALANYAPDVFLVDKKPLGIEQELKPAIEYAHSHLPQMHSVLLLRDVLDAPEETIRVWEKHDYHKAIQQFYTSILVVGSADIFDLTREYRFPASSTDKVTFCGYIRRRAKLDSRERIRQQLGIEGLPLVLVTSGGGEDGYHLLDTFTRSLALFPSHQRFQSVMILGPEMPVAQRSNLRQQAMNYDNVMVMDFTQDFISWLDAADLVVSMGGYNTVCEVLSLKKTAIVVPRVRPVREQLIRAERMARCRLLTTLHPADLGPEVLMHTITQQLNQKNKHSNELYKLDLEGLPRVARAISAKLHSGSSKHKPSSAQHTQAHSEHLRASTFKQVSKHEPLSRPGNCLYR